MINYWWKLKFTEQLLLLIVNPEVDWIPGILNVFKVGVFVTATVCELFSIEIWPVSKLDISSNTFAKAKLSDKKSGICGIFSFLHRYYFSILNCDFDYPSL